MNRATRANVATMGTIFGISGFSHGFFEMLQGNISTKGSYISAIGEAQRMWPHGNEYAFTLIPNFLITGITAMLIGLAITIWSLGFVYKERGPSILIFLFVSLLLLGGGIAQILFFPWIWLVSTRINNPLIFWRRTLQGKIQILLGRLWLLCLIISSALLVFALGIAVTGYIPTVNDPDTVLLVMLFSLTLEVVFFPLTFITGFAHDVKAMPAVTREDS